MAVTETGGGGGVVGERSLFPSGPIVAVNTATRSSVLKGFVMTWHIPASMHSRWRAVLTLAVIATTGTRGIFLSSQSRCSALVASKPFNSDSDAGVETRNTKEVLTRGECSTQLEGGQWFEERLTGTAGNYHQEANTRRSRKIRCTA